MIKECLPKVGIKLLKISYVRILFLVFLLFGEVINPYSVFKFLIFKYSSRLLRTCYIVTKHYIRMYVCTYIRVET